MTRPDDGASGPVLDAEQGGPGGGAVTDASVKMNVRIAAGMDIRIGMLMRTAREQAGLTQTEVGQVLGVSYQQIQKYEGGQNRIAAADLLRVAGLVDWKVEALLGRLPPPRSAPEGIVLFAKPGPEPSRRYAIPERFLPWLEATLTMLAAQSEDR